ncbi:uncharacterized protein MELLADRAFT_73009 [Melampsora larici-populina 98AG31]|uniref:Uncharacterized protein n=1 Tax=Melampsora larici-populina (strain 98AG31 / pathotype 3-4-7) TaxID=747676 RepID=F4S1Z0_MELLP|nr:uncharacterized protein MELLADRAFT_73009 [Melampsora larici-populina 98AG31]EGG01275.1 hypothetical protein MELLADRAFT_73009 [Melampsora larici-populina 98AG31]
MPVMPEDQVAASNPIISPLRKNRGVAVSGQTTFSPQSKKLTVANSVPDSVGKPLFS